MEMSFIIVQKHTMCTYFVLHHEELVHLHMGFSEIVHLNRFVTTLLQNNDNTEWSEEIE